MIPMSSMPRATASRAKRLARSRLPAPMDCPTNVVAAAEMPYPGM